MHSANTTLEKVKQNHEKLGYTIHTAESCQSHKEKKSQVPVLLNLYMLNASLTAPFANDPASQKLQVYGIWADIIRMFFGVTIGILLPLSFSALVAETMP